MRRTASFIRAATPAAFLLLALAVAGPALAQSKPGKDKSKEAKPITITNLTLRVVSQDSGEPVVNASVYLHFQEKEALLYLLHKREKVELDLKTDNHGYTSFPEVPQGKVLIQVVMPRWQTFGEYYELDKPKMTIVIKLHRPKTNWY